MAFVTPTPRSPTLLAGLVYVALRGLTRIRSIRSGLAHLLGWYERRLRRGGKWRPGSAHWHALLNERVGAFADAERLYIETLEYELGKPDLAMVLLNLGLLYERIGRREATTLGTRACCDACSLAAKLLPRWQLS
jgi:hypothetical protein